MREFFFQIFLFLTGAIIGIVTPLLRKKHQRLIAGILAMLLVVVSLAWAGYEIMATPASNARRSFTQDEIDAVLGAGNWRCFPDRLDGVAVKNLPPGFVVEYPLSNVDKGTKYYLGETVPGGGGATAWLQGALASREECPK